MSEWVVVDHRTGKRASVACFLSESSALDAVRRWRDRGERGGRPDVSQELLNNLVVLPRPEAPDVPPGSLEQVLLGSQQAAERNVRFLRGG